MGEISLQDAIKKLLENSPMKSKLEAVHIKDIWEELMGKTIAKYTEKIELINDTLIITTQVAPLKQELNYQKETIIKKVNEKLGAQKIKKVVIR